MKQPDGLYPLEHPEVWTDPITNAQIPKRLEANLRYRQDLMARARSDRGLQNELKSMCRQSVLFWINTFAFTYHVKWVDEDFRERTAKTTHVPFITWPIHDDAVSEIKHSIDDGHPLLFDKSRDMGASWIILTTFHHEWQFLEDRSFLEVSRGEAQIDAHNPDALFWKHDYLNQNQPWWLLPAPGMLKRTYMHMENAEGRSYINGEATTANVSVGGRKTSILFDEFARVPDGYAMWEATTDVSPSKIFNSTPIGHGTAYTDIRKGGKVKVFVMGYWDHQMKGYGRHEVIDTDGTITGKANTAYWETNWFIQDRQHNPRTRQDMARNIFIDHDTAGMLYFDSVVLSKVSAQIVAPKYVGTLDIADRRFYHDRNGKWKLWCELDETGNPPRGENYILAMDVSHGIDQANSIIGVMGRDSGKLVAEYADSGIAPHDLAGLAANAGRFFGGYVGHSYIIWEENGPGQGVTKELARIGYPLLYYQRKEGYSGEPRSPRDYGWTSTASRKESAFSDFHRVLASGQMFIPSEEGVTELWDYMIDDQGRIVAGSRSDESTGAAKRHGDRVIVYVLLNLARAEMPKAMAALPVFPPASIGALTGHEEMFTISKPRRNPFRLTV